MKSNGVHGCSVYAVFGRSCAYGCGSSGGYGNGMDADSNIMSN